MSPLTGKWVLSDNSGITFIKLSYFSFSGLPQCYGRDPSLYAGGFITFASSPLIFFCFDILLAQVYAASYL